MKAARWLVIFATGGVLYVLLELLWRGYSHWTMFIVGGLCFVLIGRINEFYTFEMPLISQMMIGAFIVSLVEFVSGCIINLWLGWNVWDYSEMPLNILGQICLPYMGLWFVLSAPAIILDDFLLYWWFGEEKPHYSLLKKCGGENGNKSIC